MLILAIPILFALVASLVNAIFTEHQFIYLIDLKMRYVGLVTIVIVLSCVSLKGQVDSTAIDIKKRQQVYNYKNKLDIPLTLSATTISIFNFSHVYSKERSSEESILGLNPDNVNGFDRRAAGNYDPDAKHASDVIFGVAIPTPLVFFAFDKKMRKDYLRLSLLYWESMSFMGVAYSTSLQLNNRHRPYTYGPDVPIDVRTKGGGKNSFYSGHTGLVATSTFFLASVFADYHPDSKFKWVIFTSAGLATIFTGYLRVRAGEHFPTDVIVGGAVGMASGILVPYFHKNKLFKDENLSLIPITGEYHGLRMTYTFK